MQAPEALVQKRIERPLASMKKLAPGPGKPPSKVAASQRARLQRAMFELVAEKGYEQVTVRELVSMAKVSSRAFYKHFRGVHDCFEATASIAGRLIQASGQHALPQPWIEVLTDIALDPQSVPTSSLARLDCSPSSGASRRAEGSPPATSDAPFVPVISRFPG